MDLRKERAINPKDRGAIKWTAIMLPEHVGLTRKYFAEDGRIEQPILDEYEIEEIEAKIHLAMAENEALEFRYWRDGFVDSVVGRVHYIDAITKDLRLVDAQGAVVRLRFRELVRVYG